MNPLQPQKKRSPGRPKENKLLRELKVKTWFNAVAEASGKTAYQLEKEFSPSYVDREKFNKQRSRLWEKYRLGKTMPTMKEIKGGRRPVALLVEDKYPGTLKWLTSPIWTLADPDIDITMEYLRSVYESLYPQIRSMLIEDTINKPRVFWRKHCDDYKRLISEIVVLNGLDGFIALLCLLRESIVCQRHDRFELTIGVFKRLEKLNRDPAFNSAQNVSRLVNQNFCSKVVV